MYKILYLIFSLLFFLSGCSSGNTAKEKIKVNNTTKNNPPIANAGKDITVYENETVIIDGSNSSDSDGNIIKYKWSQINTSININITNQSLAKVLFVAPVVSKDVNITLQLSVTDNSNQTTIDTIMIKVLKNRPPIANAGLDVEVKEGSLVTLDASLSHDPDNGIVFYQWELINNGGTSIALENPNTMKIAFQTPKVDKDEILEFQLKVIDKYGKSSIDNIYIFVFKTLPDWETHQANSYHNGYTPVTTYTTNFTKLWEWENPKNNENNLMYINPIVSFDGLIYISEDGRFEEQILYAMDEKTNQIIWQYNFGSISQLNQLAVKNNILSVTTSGHSDTFLWNFNAKTGELLAKTPFDTQWSNYLSPTIYEGIAYINTGYYGGVTSAFNIKDGTLLWNSSTYGDNDMFTPAIDGRYVYHYSGTSLYVLNKLDGTLVSTIIDSDPDRFGYSHIGSTIISTNKNIITFSGDSFSGLSGSSVEGALTRRLICFDIETNATKWKSQNAYLTHPAVSNGKIYTASNNPLRLEVLDEYDGSILWTWIPQDASISSFHRNIIVTNNLVFLNSNKAVHAISLDTKQEIWNYPEPGMLMISENKNLYISVGTRTSTGKIVAISLRKNGK